MYPTLHLNNIIEFICTQLILSFRDFKVDFVRCMHRSQHLGLVSFSITIDMEQNVRLVCHTSNLIDMQRVNMKITTLPR